MLMRYFGVINKEHYGMLWYFLEWSIDGRFLSKLFTCDIWLVDSNIVFVFFGLSARWESLDQELTVFSVEFSPCAHLCGSGAGQ